MNESKIYLELLRVGSQPVSVVARRIGLNRSSAYSVLNSLFSKGMVSSCMRGGTTFYTSCDPNAIIGYLDQQCRTFDYYKSNIKNILPKLRGLAGVVAFKKPIVSFYDGIDGLKTAMHDALSSRGVFRSYCAIDAWVNCGLEDFLVDYNNARIAESHVPLRAIVPNTKLVRNFCRSHFKNKDLYSELLFLDSEFAGGIFDNELNIYNDTISILHLVPGCEYAIVIESKEIAQMQRLLFDKVYRSALTS